MGIYTFVLKSKIRRSQTKVYKSLRLELSAKNLNVLLKFPNSHG